MNEKMVKDTTFDDQVNNYKIIFLKLRIIILIKTIYSSFRNHHA